MHDGMYGTYVQCCTGRYLAQVTTVLPLHSIIIARASACRMHCPLLLLSHVLYADKLSIPFARLSANDALLLIRELFVTPWYGGTHDRGGQLAPRQADLLVGLVAQYSIRAGSICARRTQNNDQ